MKLPAELVAYRAMAWLTGVWLLMLVFVAIPIEIWGNNDGPVSVIGTVHGFLYMVYVVVVLFAAYRRRWALGYVLLALLGGVLPFASFIVERRIITREKAALAGG